MDSEIEKHKRRFLANLNPQATTDADAALAAQRALALFDEMVDVLRQAAELSGGVARLDVSDREATLTLPKGAVQLLMRETPGWSIYLKSERGGLLLQWAPNLRYFCEDARPIKEFANPAERVWRILANATG